MNPDPIHAFASGNRYLTGNFAPVEAETTAFELKVTGHIPEALNGRFLRVGPNPVTAPDAMHYHWFGGTGMA
ncbi:carotenoid oxygenase family protein, partial [Gluconobacter cerinus]|uniref:carotenoid oxygenase family protein n=1 Tax=Gluconobacter cerinus TaxID=38307 RepID=UPI0024E09DE9